MFIHQLHASRGWWRCATGISIAATILLMMCGVALAQTVLDSESHPVHVVPVDHGANAAAADLSRYDIETALTEYGVRALPAGTTQEALRAAISIAPDEDVDAAIIDASEPLAQGRDYFYRGMSDSSIRAIEPYLERVERDPSILAHRPAFAPMLLESFLVLYQAYEVEGDVDSLSELMLRIVRLFPAGQPNPDQVPPYVREEFERLQIEENNVRVQVSWTAQHSCTVYLNGFPTATLNGRSVAINSGRMFVRIRCGGGDGLVYRVDEMMGELEVEPAFDDALFVDDERARILPRANATASTLQRIAASASRLLGDDVISWGVIDLGVNQPIAVEIGYASVAGHYRAIRVPFSESPEDAMEVGLAYLFSTAETPPPEPSVVWTPEPAWAPIGDWMREREVRITYRRKGGARKAIGWSLFGSALATGGVGVWSILEGQERDDSLSECLRSACAFTSEVIDLREEVERFDRITVGTLAASGAALVLSTVLVAIPRRDVAIEDPELQESSARRRSFRAPLVGVSLDREQLHVRTLWEF